MAFLIDGYNLLHASGVFGRGQGPGGFERARRALLNFLAASLTPEERAHTTIIFDATMAPPNLPREQEHEGMTVRFAPRESDADTLIEELVLADSAPKRLIVVSSDHRIQRAAHRRRAQAVDSDVWCGELVRRRQERTRPRDAAEQKPRDPPTPAEVAFWLHEFGGDRPDQPAGGEPIEENPAEGKGKPVEGESAKGDSFLLPEEKWGQLPPGLANPFPPGYGEDVEDEDEDN